MRIARYDVGMRRVLRSFLRPVVLAIAASFVLGFFAHAFLGLANTSVASASLYEPTLRETGKYKLVTPLLACGNPDDSKNFQEYKDLETTLRAMVDSEKKAGHATDISIYFRGLQGKWLSVNEDVKYTPASLLKVPLMIAYFKARESNPALFSTKLYYDGVVDLNSAEVFRPDHSMSPGWYSVEDLIKRMIIESGNNATNLLYQHIDEKTLNEVFTDLGLPPPPTNKPAENYISARSYNYFFRVLINATYLSPDDSEQALEILTQSKFEDGLRAGVPDTVSVADKFGERSLFDQNGTVLDRELHDCGIIFGEKQRYQLCVMTRGQDFTDLEHVIQAISKTVYDQLQNVE